MGTDSLSYALDLLRRLVKVPTINPPGQAYREIADLLTKELEGMGLSVEVVEVPEEYLDRNYPYAPRHKGYGRYLVIARTSDGAPALHINGHYDVVPPGPGWVRDPFKLAVEDGRAYGRGTTDMKGGIAAFLAALKEVLKSSELRVPVELAFVPDEESGGVGTKYLVEEVGVRPKYVLIPEPTTSEALAIGHKGMVRGLIKVIGKQGHAARPWDAVNAFEKACEVVHELRRKLLPLLRSVRSGYPFLSEEAKYVTLSLGGYAVSPSMKDNVIPGEFIFSFDMRTVPEVSNSWAFDLLSKVLREVAEEVGVKMEISKLIDVPAASTPTDSPLVKYVVRVAEAVLRLRPRMYVNTGRYDLVYYRQVGSHVVVYGPGVKGQAHAVNEYTTLEELRRFTQIYSEVLRNLKELS